MKQLSTATAEILNPVNLNRVLSHNDYELIVGTDNESNIYRFIFIYNIYKDVNDNTTLDAEITDIYCFKLNEDGTEERITDSTKIGIILDEVMLNMNTNILEKPINNIAEKLKIHRSKVKYSKDTLKWLVKNIPSLNLFMYDLTNGKLSKL